MAAPGKSKALVVDLREKLRTGELVQLPTVRQLQEIYGVAYETARRVRQGVLEEVDDRLLDAIRELTSAVQVLTQTIHELTTGRTESIL